MNKNTPFPLTLHTVIIPIVERMIITSVTLPLEMLQAANTYTQLQGRTSLIRTHFCRHTNQPEKTTSGIVLNPDSLLSQTEKADLVLLPALWRNPLPIVRRNRPLIQWIIEQYNAGTHFAAAGTGVAFLAEAGLLNDKPATTHWYYLHNLQKRYPRVKFKPNHLITQSERIYCAGSVNSVADLMIHIIRLSLGNTIAHQVEQQFSHEIRRPMEDSYFTDGHPTTDDDETIIVLLDWLQQHFTQELTLQDISDAAGLTPRTLARRFKAVTQEAPMKYLQKLRLHQASELLRKTNLNIIEIALQSGYNNPNYFSRLFRAHYQLTPAAFRKSVRSKLFSIKDN
ncbi:HTH-type transcriptional regulator CdhR [invertebrate metagenome]|uniref:HTH-type transcriptional regulator CdhR n=1 Tax=invertebrate metagenome TaxID=1711999 RepID=A0A2H9TBB2_9ZZZZ